VSLGKQAKTLTKGQIGLALNWLANSRYPTRNRTILLLSARAGLRAKEIAGLTWTMVTDAEGEVSQAIQLHDNASKGRSGRTIPMHSDLKSALQDLHREVKPKPDDFVITTERSKRTSPQVIVNPFARWYETDHPTAEDHHTSHRTGRGAVGDLDERRRQSETFYSVKKLASR
jgi:integrase